MRVSPSIRTHRRIACRVVSFVLAAIICGTATELVFAEESESNHPELKLSLREAIQAAIDNNVNVRLLKERIAAAQSQANTSLGTLLPNVSGFVNGRNQTVNLAAFGLPPDRLAGLGLTRSVTDSFEVYDARATLVQNIFSLSLIQRWRAARAGVDVATLEAEVTKRDVMAMVGLLYIEALRADEAIKARQADIDLSQQLLKLARDRRAAGIATGPDEDRSHFLQDDHDCGGNNRWRRSLCTVLPGGQKPVSPGRSHNQRRVDRDELGARLCGLATVLRSFDPTLFRRDRSPIPGDGGTSRGNRLCA